MKQTVSIVCASVFAVGISAAAQSAATTQRSMDTGKEMTVTGCVEKTKSGGYWLTNAMPSPTMPGAATMPRSSGDTTMPKPAGDTTMPRAAGETTAPAAKRADMSGMRHMTYNLENGKDLDKHVGHKIEVTGHAKAELSGDQVRGTATEGEVKARDFDVKSMKMIAVSCT